VYRLYVGFSVPFVTTYVCEPANRIVQLVDYGGLELTNGYRPDGKRCFRTAGATTAWQCSTGTTCSPGDRQRGLVSFYSRGATLVKSHTPTPAEPTTTLDRLGSIVGVGEPTGR